MTGRVGGIFGGWRRWFYRMSLVIFGQGVGFAIDFRPDFGPVLFPALDQLLQIRETLIGEPVILHEGVAYAAIIAQLSAINLCHDGSSGIQVGKSAIGVEPFMLTQLIAIPNAEAGQNDQQVGYYLFIIQTVLTFRCFESYYR